VSAEEERRSPLLRVGLTEELTDKSRRGMVGPSGVRDASPRGGTLPLMVPLALPPPRDGEDILCRASGAVAEDPSGGIIATD